MRVSRYNLEGRPSLRNLQRTPLQIILEFTRILVSGNNRFEMREFTVEICKLVLDLTGSLR